MRGLDGPQCPERVYLDQATRPDDFAWHCQRMCSRCGRVTSRRDIAGKPWCGGEPVTRAQRIAEIAPGHIIGS